MDSTVTFAKELPMLNGAEIVLVNTNHGIIDFKDLKHKLEIYKNRNIKYFYINYPNNPTGAQLSEIEFKNLIDIALKNNLLIVHDHDICFVSYKKQKPIISIFNIKRAQETAIEIFTFSKEFGLSGLRVGLIVGNKDIIDMIKFHNYERNIMIPKLNQKLACIALKKFNKNEIIKNISQSMKTLINEFEKLGWKNIIKPHAGISFLLEVPKKFIDAFGKNSGELFAFFLISEYGIGVGPAIVNNRNLQNYIRILSMENSKKCSKVFSTIKNEVSPDMEVPKELYKKYIKILSITDTNYIR